MTSNLNNDMKKNCTDKKTWQEAKILSTNTIAERTTNRIAEYESNPIRCKHCGAKFDYQHRFKTFCNRSCSASYNNKGISRNRSGVIGSINVETGDRMCRVCGNNITHHRHKKIFCSINCASEYKKRQSIENWKNNFEHMKELPRGIRNHILELSGFACSICGWNKVNPYSGHYSLVVDHIDGNSENNDPKNLRVICPNCDSLTSTYMSLNRGNGRMSRKLQRIRDNKKLNNVE